MSTRQYIGARYVPKFYENGSGGNDWTPNTPYEALTIVTYGVGSYTSKKPVPSNVGNPSENPQYWISTGLYNAQVEAYRQEVEQYKNVVENVDTKVEALYTNDVKLVMFGDSWLHYGGWGLQLSNIMEASETYNYGLSGSGFAREGFVTFHDQLNTAINALDLETRKTITHVVVGGGLNDQSVDDDTLFDAVDLFFSDAKTAFPNAKIYYFANWGAIPFKLSYWKKISGIRTRAIGRKVICLEDIEFQLLNAGSGYMEEDNNHPKLSGYILIAKSIFNAINGNNFSQLGDYSYKNGIVDTRITRNGRTITFDCKLNATQASDYTSGMYLGTMNVGKTSNNETFAEMPIFDKNGVRFGFISFGTGGVQLWDVSNAPNAPTRFTASFDLVGLLGE